MPKTFLLVAACFATGASELTVQPVGGARPRCFPSDEICTRATGASKPSIKLNARSWSSHALATAIVDILLREKLGHEVQIVTLGDNETTDNSCAALPRLLFACAPPPLTRQLLSAVTVRLRMEW